MSNQIISIKHHNVQRLNEKFGTKWLYIGRGRKGMQRSPFSKPPWKKLVNYKRWLWGEMQNGNQAILGLLRFVNDDTVFVDDAALSGAQKAIIITNAKNWYQENLTNL